VAFLTVSYITNRSTHPLVEKQRGQYELLAESLRAQVFTNYELIIVDRDNDLPRPELAWIGDRVRFLRPHTSPWPLGTFAPSIARNTALAAARGDIVFGLDDCVSFDSHLLKHVVDYVARGLYLAPTYGAPGDRQSGPPHPQALCGGIVAYPRARAIELGGWEERFAACCAYEDFEFSERLGRNGVRFISDPAAHVTLHSHISREKGGNWRCHEAIWHLLQGQARANVPWTPEQLSCFEARRCPLENAGHSGCPTGECKLPRPTPETLALMRDYECRNRALFPGEANADTSPL